MDKLRDYAGPVKFFELLGHQWRGEWESAATYHDGDLVVLDGTVYIATCEPHVGLPPTESFVWTEVHEN